MTMTRVDSYGNIKRNRKWSVEVVNDKHINLLVNGTTMAVVFWSDKATGTGWRVLSQSPNWPSSRRAWPSAYDAARSVFGSNVSKLFAGL